MLTAEEDTSVASQLEACMLVVATTPHACAGVSLLPFSGSMSVIRTF